MTEDEAKTKTCHRTLAPVSMAPWWPTIAPCPCLGSACMAWRWIDKAGTDDDGKANYYPGHWKGFCGLAGKP